ncbi:hypothetical protein DCS_03753 [Drechmeria coniospora]|uniref:Deubiquitination-protection protein dph1 n=1 Tax=Drechmeria coniospora TaxID=98403 RepID=A0A151GI03_DRECN|nr:hypothetical protein DCS_03753 [Drechmeria coniospora]KYK56747.1 hypothetical protein DCS_03753 [Drechmeria coniospora]
MTDNAEAAGDAQITFKVKTSSDGNHVITMAEAATVLELKTKLAGQDLENIPIERQRLIYSGRVMKNDDTLGSYKIKPNNTIHMVKSAASNPTRPAATSASTPPAIPANMASGTANNPLAGLTGARYAGHQMGPPMDEDGMRRMMSDPNVQQAVNEAFNNPEFVNMIIQSNPMLRNMPGAREMMPYLRQVMTNPDMMERVMQMQRAMAGGAGSFPAPGATDSTAAAAAAEAEQGNANDERNPLMNPFMMGAMGRAPGAGNDHMETDINRMLQAMNRAGPNQFGGLSAAAGTDATPQQESRDGQATAAGQQGADRPEGAASQQAANPFAALFPPSGDAGLASNPFGMSPEMMQQMMQMLGGGGATPNPPADNRSPEERYAEQLRQLNDMGFFDFDRNVAALRRSGGSVQGAIEHLLNATD